MAQRVRQTSRNKTLCYLQGEKQRLSFVLFSNGYPLLVLQKITKTTKLSTGVVLTIQYKSTAVLPYVKGISEQLRRCLQQQGMRAVFKA